MTLGTKKVWQDLQLQGHSLIGSAASGGNLTLKSTSHATKGKILFGTSAYDEVNNRLGIATASPSVPLHAVSTGSNTAWFVSSAAAGTGAGAGFYCMSSNAPTASGHRLGFTAGGVNDSGTARLGPYIGFYAAEAWTLGSAHGGYIDLLTPPIGSAAASARLRVNNDGTINMPIQLILGASIATAPATSAGIEISSTTKALLNARMTTTQRDALTAVAGMTIYNSTTGRVENYEGSAWSGAGGAWTAYTPTWTNLSVGNGTQDCAYLQVGKTVFYRIKLVLGSTSTVSAASNSASLPVTIKSIGGTATHVVGYGTAYDTSAGAQYPIGHRQDGLLMCAQSSAANASWLAIVSPAAQPFAAAWATGDEIAIFGSYEAA